MPRHPQSLGNSITSRHQLVTTCQLQRRLTSTRARLTIAAIIPSSTPGSDLANCSLTNRIAWSLWYRYDTRNCSSSPVDHVHCNVVISNAAWRKPGCEKARWTLIGYQVSKELLSRNYPFGKCTCTNEFLSRAIGVECRTLVLRTAMLSTHTTPGLDGSAAARDTHIIGITAWTCEACRS